MQAFAAQDEQHRYPTGGVVFVGSSSIRLWDLAASFPELDPPRLNRGFGGSEISDSIRNLDLLVLRHRPRTVVVYAGDNDIAGGKSAATVAEDFKTLTAKISNALPETRILYISIKPSILRWKLSGVMAEANRAIRAECERNPRLEFVDIWAPMLGDDGKPRPELFRRDGLHLSKQGYELWTKLVSKSLKSPTANRDETASRLKTSLLPAPLRHQ